MNPSSGRLEQVPGFGKRRLQATRDALSGRLRWRDSHPVHAYRAGEQAPTVAELLSVDHEYRQKVEDDQLPLISSEPYNPSGSAYLPENLVLPHLGQQLFTVIEAPVITGKLHAAYRDEAGRSLALESVLAQLKQVP